MRDARKTAAEGAVDVAFNIGEVDVFGWCEGIRLGAGYHRLLKPLDITHHDQLEAAPPGSTLARALAIGPANNADHAAVGVG